jgi:hypothetical protein
MAAYRRGRKYGVSLNVGVIVISVSRGVESNISVIS